MRDERKNRGGIEEILGCRIVSVFRARCGIRDIRMRDAGCGMKKQKITGYGRHAENLDSNQAGSIKTTLSEAGWRDCPQE